jgi:hypothetical protein
MEEDSDISEAKPKSEAKSENPSKPEESNISVEPSDQSDMVLDQSENPIKPEIQSDISKESEA